MLTGLVCDGIIAPGYAPGTAAQLSRKKNGRFLVVEANEAFTPPADDVREVFGLRLIQRRDVAELSAALLDQVVGGALPETAVRDLLLGLAVARFTKSNAVCYVRDGMTLGIGAGQQSRIGCTRLAGGKADTWWLRRHPAIRVLAFRPGTRHRDRINWQTRLVEGGLNVDEAGRLAETVSAPAEELTADERTEWLRRLTDVLPRRLRPFAAGAGGAARRPARHPVRRRARRTGRTPSRPAGHRRRLRDVAQVGVLKRYFPAQES